MRIARLTGVGVLILAVAGAFGRPQAPSPVSSKLPNLPPTLALAGGTLVDVTAWGRSANDLSDAVVLVRAGRIVAAGPRATTPIPPGSRVIDCTGKFLIPGLVDGFAGMNSQVQANANLYMGVTTVVAAGDARRGAVDQHASPSPHLYLVDSVGTTDDWSLLIANNGSRSGWAAKLRQHGAPVELSPEDTANQIADTARLGTRVLWLGHNLTAANTQAILAKAHPMGLATYGEFISTPYRVGIEAGVDALLHMGRYELGAVPEEVQLPLVENPEGSAAMRAYGYSERVPTNDANLHAYAHFVAMGHAALMPTFSQFYLRLPGHRNLWKEPAAALLSPAGLSQPSDPATGEMVYPLPGWSKHLPPMVIRNLEDNLQRRADQQADRLWAINEVLFRAGPHYLAASGADTMGTMPGISLHTELELLVRLGLSPREALAAATNNYSEQLGWRDLGLIEPGRRADILVLDGDPTANIWNTRRISTLLFDGNVMDREGLLKSH